MPKNWQNFLLALLFACAFRLLPLFIEWWSTGGVQVKSLIIIASLFALSVGVVSKNRFIFGLSVFVSVLFAFTYGMVSAEASSMLHVRESAIAGILGFSVMYAVERWNLHLVENKAYFSFEEEKDG